MTLFFAVFAFVFGMIVGSFLNVVILRLNTGVGIGGRSKCMSCGHKLSWYELIPVISYIIQLGKCRNCKSKISPQYMLVELLTGVVFALIVCKFFPSTTETVITVAKYLVATCLLMVIAVYDLRHKIIPDSFVYSFDALALLGIFVGGVNYFHTGHLWTILAGPILAAPFLLISVVSKGTWMGYADSKLALGIGWLLGLSGGINAIVLAFWIGAFLGVASMIARYGKFKPRMEIPFGPYMILGTYLVLLFGLQVVDVRMLAAMF